MDAHEWNESLDRIISTIAEMIDLLKNESRRWATSPIFSTPLPSPATASPPPTPALVPTLPPPISATAPTNSATPKQAPRIALLPPKSAPFTVTKPTITILVTRLRKAGNSFPAEKNMMPVKGVIEKGEWRPPWHFTTTYPNVVGRTEWRPPWRNIKFLPASP
ncbi:hypothetical protein HanIR_Chr09g0435261 [Helianthus annuus]|nr:hypothetical protein HanIR_Chr09g0435261 [Helianthus annuus]